MNSSLLTPPAPTSVRHHLIYQLTVTLLGIDPPVWRRLAVLTSIRLSRLHRCIQAAMGWQDYHLHEFRIGPRVYGIPDDEFYAPKQVTEDDSRISLQKVAPVPPAAFMYEYDFGDSWQHIVLVDQIRSSREKLTRPMCLAGERACPPEDCGGISGYADFLEAIADPRHEEHEVMLTWAGGHFDPEHFDRDAVNDRLAHLR